VRWREMHQFAPIAATTSLDPVAGRWVGSHSTEAIAHRLGARSPHTEAKPLLVPRKMVRFLVRAVVGVAVGRSSSCLSRAPALSRAAE